MVYIPNSNELARILNKSQQTKPTYAVNPTKRLGTVSSTFNRTNFATTVPVTFDGEDVAVNLAVYAAEVPLASERVICEKVGNAWVVSGIYQTANRKGMKFATSDMTKLNNATFSDIPGLFMTVEPNQSYWVEARIDYLNTGDTTNAATGDMKITWEGPTGTGWLRHVRGLGTDSTSQANSVMRSSAHQITTDVQYGTVTGGSFSFVTEEGYLVVGDTGGIVKAQGAQWNVSATTTLTFKNTSYIKWERVT